VTDSQQFEQGKGIGSAEHTRTIAQKRTAACVLITDEHDRVLICEPVYKDVWEPPGGAGELNESPRDTAAREAKEELGLVVAPGNLLAVDYVPPMQGRTEALCFVFDGGRLSPEQAEAIVLDPMELRSWRWSTPADRLQFMRPLVARRLDAALAARGTGYPAYLEDGRPVGQQPFA
jgi:8-oxo-dGTP diphosphatase